jgi:hypothetical protein
MAVSALLAQSVRPDPGHALSRGRRVLFDQDGQLAAGIAGGAVRALAEPGIPKISARD